MSDTPPHWHMKKEFNIVHVLMTMAMIFSFITFIFSFDKRIDNNTLELDHVKQRHEQDVEFTKNQRTEDQRRVEKTLDSINRKLDKILETK